MCIGRWNILTLKSLMIKHVIKDNHIIFIIFTLLKSSLVVLLTSLLTHVYGC